MPGTLEERMLQSAKVADLAAAELKRRVKEAFGLPKVVLSPTVLQGQTAPRAEVRKDNSAPPPPPIVQPSVVPSAPIVKVEVKPLRDKPAPVADASLRRLIVGVYWTAGLFTGIGAYLLRGVPVSLLVCSAGAGVPFLACVIWMAIERRRHPQRPRALLFHATIALLVAFLVVALFLICVALGRKVTVP